MSDSGSNGTFPRQLLPGLFQISGGVPDASYVNIYLLVGPRITLIEAGQEADMACALASLRKLGILPTEIKQIVATSGDYDHVGAIGQWLELNPEIQLRMHSEAWAEANSGDSYQTLSYAYDQPARALMVKGGVLRDGQRILAGRNRWQVIHTPGAAPGEVCLVGRTADKTILFGGDTVSWGMRSLAGADLAIWVKAYQTWRQSLATLKAYRFEWVLNAHNSLQKPPIPRATFDRYLAHFGTMLNPWW